MMGQRTSGEYNQLLEGVAEMLTGFDAYKKVLASDIDLVILAAPPICRRLCPLAGRYNHHSRSIPHA